MPISLENLALAFEYAELRGQHAPGTAQAKLRRDILARRDEAIEARAIDARRERDRLMAIQIEDMPPDTDDVALLLDTIAFRLGETTRAAAWRACGINPDRGRGLLARSAHAVDWPIFHTIRHTALA